MFDLYHVDTFAGGSGGAGTAGLGGRSGPFRLSDGNDIYQVSQAEKDLVSNQVTAAAREMAKKALAEKLAAINMSETELVGYEQMMNSIGGDIRQLRAVLEAAQAKSRERTWLKLETQGELDENRLVDGITGERNVYKRRGKENPYQGMMQEKPKRLRFVMDVSGSMYRFNGEDKRLNRLLEVTLMIMEALQGFEWKYQYSIVGHSGDTADILLVDYGKAPKNAKERMQIIEKMVAHSQYCGTGDNTTKATDLAVCVLMFICCSGHCAHDTLFPCRSEMLLRRTLMIILYLCSPMQISRDTVSEPTFCPRCTSCGLRHLQASNFTFVR